MFYYDYFLSEISYCIRYHCKQCFRRPCRRRTLNFKMRNPVQYVESITQENNGHANDECTPGTLWLDSFTNAYRAHDTSTLDHTTSWHTVPTMAYVRRLTGATT